MVCSSTLMPDFDSRIENWRAHGRWRVSSHALSIA
jgi:hypothetical protein